MSETDEFKDAVETSAIPTPEPYNGSDDEGETTFEVKEEELKVIIATLASDFPEDYDSLSKAYILSVASKPYSQDPTVRRPLNYSIEKLNAVLEWRNGNAVGLREMLELVREDNCVAAEKDDPERFERATALTNNLNYGSMYWHGLDKIGRPILWIRCGRMPWYPDVDAQVKSLTLLADTGISAMPEGVTDFVVLSDSNSPPPPNPQFMINVLQALVKGYPDRLNLLVSVPVASIIQFIMKLLIPLMPGRLASKILLIGEEESKEKLSSILLRGEEDIPTFLGGSCDHDAIYPVAGTFPERNLKFDFAGMEKRLIEAVAAFVKK